VSATRMGTARTRRARSSPATAVDGLTRILDGTVGGKPPPVELHVHQDVEMPVAPDH
jgi:hypothetical protein